MPDSENERVMMLWNTG